MRSAIAGFALGILLLQQQPALMSWSALAGWAVVAILCLVISCKFKNAVLCSVIRIFAAAVLGWCWASLIALHGLAQQLSPALEERDITVVGVVTSLPAQADYGQRFQFSIERVVSPDIRLEQLPKKVLLSWYAVNPEANLIAVQPGERWQLNIRLRRPHGLANPYGFDYEVWLLEQGLGATGTVRADKADENSATKNLRRQDFVFSIKNCIEWSRGKLRNRILSALAGQPYAAIIVALVIGDQNGIAQNDWQVFARTGVNHLIAISGLHISMLAGLAAAIMLYCWRHPLLGRFQLPLWVPAQKMAALASVLIAALYVALAGFGVPAQRTLIMICVVAGTIWADRKTSVTNVLFLALGVVLLVDPWAVLAPGFWLSFSAVGIIFYVSQGRRDQQAESSLSPQFAVSKTSTGRRWLDWCRQASVTQYAITIGLVPLTLLLFNQVSLVSPIANAIATPVISLLVTPLALLGSILASVVPDPAGGWLLLVTHQILSYLFACLSWLNQFSWAVWQAPRPAIWMLICAVIGTCWCLAPKGWPLRWTGLIAWLPLCLNTSDTPREGEFNVTALDVGQGMALLIETAHHRMLYDTGPAYSPTSDAGSRVIYPYLTMRGINHLDGLMISHNDTDHSGGAISLMQQLKFAWVSSSLKSDTQIVQMAGQLSEYSDCLAGQQWQWDGVQFEVLHPTVSIYDNEKWKPNARSCTLKITQGRHAILLAGDIEAVQEKELVRRVPEKLAATVLLAPHHGSGTSSTMEFLNAVHPRYALFQLGYHNRYHHPKTDVWQRYADLGITRLRSDHSGAITVNFADEVNVEEYRQTHARYWYAAD